MERAGQHYVSNPADDSRPHGRARTETPRVPDHELVRRIDRGSYGSVWLARTVTGIWRAVKVVESDDFLDSKPFEREFEGVRRFEPLSREHDAFVDILQTGRSEGRGSFYYVMELADDAAGSTGSGRRSDGCLRDPQSYEAQTLHRILERRRRLPVMEVLALGRRLTEGLEFLHGEGLIHRDIKPSNIIFVAGQPKLADIGLVTSATDAVSFVGTEGYVAPEGPNSTWADLYSLGMVLYEAGMGRNRRDFPEVAEGVTDPGERRLLMELNAILLKACAADPARRYADARAFREDLECVQHGGSVRRKHVLVQWGGRLARGGLVLAVLGGVLVGGERWQSARQKKAAALGREAKQQVAEALHTLAERQIRAGDLSGALLNLAAEDLARTGVGEVESGPSAHWKRVRQEQMLATLPRLTGLLRVEGGVVAATFSPEGRRLVVADKGGRVSVWRTDDGALLMGPVARELSPLNARFTRDGRRVLIDAGDPRGNAFKWNGGRTRASVLDAQTGALLAEGPGNSRFGVFSPDERWMASVMPDRNIEVRDMNSGSVQCVLSGQEGTIVSVVFSPDGRRMASLEKGDWIRVWGLPDGEALMPAFQPGPNVQQIAFTSDGRRLATTHLLASSASVFQLWEIGSKAERVLWTESAGFLNVMNPGVLGGRAVLLGDGAQGCLVRSLTDGGVVRSGFGVGGAGCWAVTPDGLWGATGGQDGMVHVWDLETGISRMPPLPNALPAGAVAFSGDGVQLAVGADDGVVKIWNLAQMQEETSPIRLAGGLPFVPPGTLQYPAAISEDGRWLATSTHQGKHFRTQILDLASWTSEPMPESAEPAECGGITWAHRTMQMVTFDGFAGFGSPHRGAVVWRRAEDGWHPLHLPHPGIVGAAVFTEDDARVLTRDMQGNVRIWRTADGAALGTLDIPMQSAPWSTLAPSGTVLVALREGGLSLGFTDGEGKPMSGPMRLEWGFRSGQFSRDGGRFASMHMGNILRLFETRSGKDIAPIQPSLPPALWVEWSPDGQQLLVVDDKSRLHLIDVARHRLRSLGDAAGPGIRRANFSADGQCIVMTDDRRDVWVIHAGTLESVTPRYRHPGEVQFMAVTSSGVLVTLSDPGVARRWNLKESRLPARVAEEAATVLSGRIPGPREPAEPLTPDALMASLGRLRKSAPLLTQRTAEEVQAWREQRCQTLDTPAQIEAAIFHLHQMELENPRHPRLASLRDKIAAVAVPQREASAPRQCLDLSRFYTHSPGLLAGGELTGLPVGLHPIQGTLFDLRGILRLEAPDYHDQRRRRGKWAPPPHPAAQRLGIPVEQTCARLVFLQGLSDFDGPQGIEVARWRMHYQDGTSVDFPIHHGSEVANWRGHWNPSPAPNGPVPAWSRRLPSPHEKTEARLYKIVWSNPRPKLLIRRLDFLPGAADALPFVVAITAEP